jgi:hypothetical protein
MIRQDDMSTHREPQRAPTESDENMAAWEAGVQRMKADLQSRFPELFDEAGELRTKEAMRLILQRTGGKRRLSGTEFLELMGQAPKPRADAS